MYDIEAECRKVFERFKDTELVEIFNDTKYELIVSIAKSDKGIKIVIEDTTILPGQSKTTRI